MNAAVLSRCQLDAKHRTAQLAMKICFCLHLYLCSAMMPSRVAPTNKEFFLQHCEECLLLYCAIKTSLAERNHYAQSPPFKRRPNKAFGFSQELLYHNKKEFEQPEVVSPPTPVRTIQNILQKLLEIIVYWYLVSIHSVV